MLENRKIGEKEMNELEKIFNDNKGVLDRLGKKETTDQDIWNFIDLIEKNLIEEFLTDLWDIERRIFSADKGVRLHRLIEKWKKRR